MSSTSIPVVHFNLEHLDNGDVRTAYVYHHEHDGAAAHDDDHHHPEGDSCETEADGPTFRSLDCRLGALRDATQARDGLGDLRERLLVTLGKAKDRNDLAASWCSKAKTPTSVRLRQVAQQLAQYGHGLRGLAARKHIADEIREPLAETADAIRADARALRGDLACPEDATSP
jgi:hypothetical protein